jgi:predicted flap endonuclease-1-like 5' DNA nuclease/Tfp pilus assembly protein PilO
MIWCLLVALAAGVLIGLGWRGLRATREREAFENDWRGRLDTSHRDLEARAARLRDVEGKYASLQAASGASDAELGKLRTRLSELEPLTAQITDRDNRLGLLDADLRKARDSHAVELANLRQKLADSEQWRLQLDQARGAAKASDDKLAALQKRIAELEPLAGQLAQRDSKIRELEALRGEVASRDKKIAELEGLRGEIAARDQTIAGLEPLRAQLGERDRRIAELEALRGELATRDKKIVDLERLRDEIAARDQKIAELEDLRGQIGVRDAELGRLRARLAEVDRLGAEVRDWTAKHHTMQTKFAEVDADRDLLRKRIAELEPLTGQLAQRDAKIRELEALRAQLAERDKRIAELEALRAQITDRDARIRELEGLRPQITQRDARLRDLDGEIVKLKARIAELDPLAGAVRERDERLKFVDSELRTLRARLGALEPFEREVNSWRLRYGELETKTQQGFRTRDGEIERLRRLLQELRARPPETIEVVREVKLQAPALSPPRMPRQRKPAVRRAVPRPAPKPRAAPRKPPRRAKDDLELIYGVGPKLAKFLNRRGIYYFRQVARWDNKDITRFEAQLPEFKGRIKREGWVKSARAEHLKKYGREP